MNRRGYRLLLLHRLPLPVLLVFAITGIAWTFASVAASFAAPAISDPFLSGENEGRPIGDFLREDGTFHNASGYPGAIDLAGYSMRLDNAGMPVFVLDDANGGDPNDLWTLESVEPGVSGQVRDLAVRGDNLFVLGWFFTAGGVNVSQVARYDLTTETWHALTDQ